MSNQEPKDHKRVYTSIRPYGDFKQFTQAIADEIAKYGMIDVIISLGTEYDDYNDVGIIEITGWVPMTPKEIAYRDEQEKKAKEAELKREQKAKKDREAKELKEYQRLKKKFDNK